MRPLLLDLFCGAGGAAVGYDRAGFDVVGVDIAPQPNYPFEFHQADALEFLSERGREVDAVHASPPCQGYLNLGGVNRALGRSYDHPDLIAATREAMPGAMPYVIENVEDARPQLLDPVRVCGTGLGRPLRRHRLFESNVPLEGVLCEHGRFTEKKYWTGWRPKGEVRLSTVVQVYGNAGGREHWPAAMGIDWMAAEEMCEAIPPDYTEHIGRHLMAAVRPARRVRAERSAALAWAAQHVGHWTAHFSTQEQRRIGDWLARQVHMEAVRVAHDLPDTVEGRIEASRVQAALEAS